MKEPGSPSGMKTVGAFLNQRACSDTLFHVLNNCAYASPLKTEERAAQSLAGGLMHYGYQCGMIWGAALAAGAHAFRLIGPGPRAEAAAILAARRLVDSFNRLNGEVNCAEITGTDRSSTALQLTTYFLLKGGSLGCFKMAANYAPVAFGDINAVLAAQATESLSPPVSCAAQLARQWGASDLHTTMVAGFAGGIGLSGGACGALAAAIWLRGMKTLNEGGSLSRRGGEGEAVMAAFEQATGRVFECAAIVGRRFEGVEDHAAWVRAGGCAKLIDLLATV